MNLYERFAVFPSFIHHKFNYKWNSTLIYRQRHDVSDLHI